MFLGGEMIGLLVVCRTPVLILLAPRPVSLKYVHICWQSLFSLSRGVWFPHFTLCSKEYSWEQGNRGGLLSEILVDSLSG